MFFHPNQTHQAPAACALLSLLRGEYCDWKLPDENSSGTATHPRYKDVPLLGKQVLNKLTIAPNPANSTVSVQLPPYFVEANATLLLYDLSGKQVKNWTLDNAANATELLVNDLPNGAYIMQYIVDGVALANAKIAIQH